MPPSLHNPLECRFAAVLLLYRYYSTSMDVVKLRQLVFELENDPGTATQKVQAMSKSQ